jgi:hypothetical protein
LEKLKANNSNKNMANNRNGWIEIEKYKKFFKGLGRLLDIIGLLGVVASILLSVAIISDLLPYMGKYAQMDFVDVILSLAISLFITFLGVKIGKHDFYSNRYLIIAALIIFPMPFFGIVSGLGAILWIIFLIQGIRGFLKIRALKKEKVYDLIFDKNIPQSSLIKEFSNKKSENPINNTGKLKSVKNPLIIIILVLIILGVSFYWFAVRPSQIRKECSWILVKAYTQEEKNSAKKYLEENCPTADGIADRIIWKNKGEVSQSCIENMDMLYAPTGNKNQKRPATDNEYAKCLRENGISDPQLFSSRQLKTIQQGIDDQSAKIDTLQEESTNTPNISSSTGIQSIIQSSIDKTNSESEEKCQKDLSEYNTCLSEYNSKMAEYNSCLSESSDPNSWRYKSFCSKPSNYCFKPVCAY